MIVLVFITAVAALIWGTFAMLRGSLIWGCLAYLIVAVCFGYDFAKFSVGPLPVTLDRIVLAGLVVAFFVQRKLGRTDPRPLFGCDALLGLLLACLAISTFTHDFRTALPGGAPPVGRLLVGYLVPAIVYWIARQSPHSQRSVTAIQGVLTCFGLYLAVTGILEIAQQWSLVFPSYIANPKAGLHFGRARGPMLTSVTFGLYLAVCLLAGWVAWPRLRRLPQLLLLAAFPLAAAGIYFSYTRSVWLGAALGLVTVMALTLRGRVRKVVLGSLAAIALLGLVTSLDKLMSFQRETSASETRDSAELRGSFVYVSWRMFQERPIFGYGFGHFLEAKRPFLFDRTTDLNLQSIHALAHHNTLLSLLTETGMVGVSLFLALMVAWARHAWALVRNPFLPAWARSHGVLLLGAFGVYALQLLFHELSYTPLDNSLLFFLAGVAVGLRSLALRQLAAGVMSTKGSLSVRDPAWLPQGA